MRNTYIDYQTFASTLKNTGFTVAKLDIIYNISDHRSWTAVVNPDSHNILVTYTINKNGVGNRYFDIIANNKVLLDVYVEDIYQVIENLTGIKTTTTYFDNHEQ
jgi:hypothetical protein